MYWSSKSKTLVISNGVTAKDFDNIPVKVGRQNDYRGSCFPSDPIKDVKTLINSFAIAKQNIPDELGLWVRWMKLRSILKSVGTCNELSPRC